MENIVLNYYDVGTQDNPVVSNSSLSCLNPEEGGSPQLFMNFFKDKNEEEELKSFTRGKLIHRFIEHPELFVVSEIDAPTEMMDKMLKAFVNVCYNFKQGLIPNNYGMIDANLVSTLTTESAKQAQILEMSANLETLANLIELDKDNCFKLLRYARAINNSYKSYTEANILGTIVSEHIPYIQYLIKARTKIALTKADKAIIDRAITSLSTTPKVAELLNLGGHGDLDSFTDLVYKEVPIYWQEIVNIAGDDLLTCKVNCKALLDHLKVNHAQKYIKYIDLKSTSKSVYLYQDSFEYYRTYRQLGTYKKAIISWFKNTFPDYNIKDYSFHPYIIPVETAGMGLCSIYPVGPAWIDKGSIEFRSLLSRFAWHKLKDMWYTSYEEFTNGGVLSLKDPV